MREAQATTPGETPAAATERHPPADKQGGARQDRHPQAERGKQGSAKESVAKDRRAQAWQHSWQHGDPGTGAPAKAQRPRRASGPLLKKRFLSHRTRSARKAGPIVVSQPSC